MGFAVWWTLNSQTFYLGKENIIVTGFEVAFDSGGWRRIGLEMTKERMKTYRLEEAPKDALMQISFAGVLLLIRRDVVETMLVQHPSPFLFAEDLS